MLSAPGAVVQVAESAPRPARWRVRLVSGLVAVLLLVVLVAAGIAWYFSGVALAVDHTVDYPQQVQPGPGAAIRLNRDADTQAPGTAGLVWAEGNGLLGPVLSGDATSVTREFTPIRGGVPAPWTRVRVDSYLYRGDPRSALGLPFSDILVSGPLGPLPAWFVPGRTAPGPSAAGRTWVVFVHGHDGDRQESLRYLRAWHERGLPVLVTSYRNDVGAPSSPDGRHHLGDTEWQDVETAVGWARDHGAGGVVLAGWSMGGSIALQVAARSRVAEMVRGLLLDSPVIDWRDVFAVQGADRGLPQFEVALAQWTLQRRSGISLDRLDWVARASELRVPTLILHSGSDDYVPDGPSVRLAQARPDLVTLVRIPGARHTMDWNVDPVRYEATMQAWFSRLSLPPSPAPSPPARGTWETEPATSS
jgi:pimeloyl-ACP methyl ester carboxylesterase